MHGFKEFAQKNGAPESMSRDYQLYYDDVTPRRWYLSVNGSEAKLIKSNQLNEQRAFRNWCSDHGHRPPMTEKVPMFELMIGELYDAAIKNEGTLPFFLTDAGNIELLETFFSSHVPNMVRSKGDEYLDGKCGDFVRVNMDLGRFFFKWQSLKLWCQRSFNASERDLDAVKMFISAKGGYQGEKGARDWFRWRYFVPFDVFGEEVIWRLLHPDEEKDG